MPIPTTVRRASIFLAVIGLSALIAVAIVSSPVAAQSTGDANVTAKNPAEDAGTVHNWEFTNDTKLVGVDEIHVNYTETNVSYVEDVSIETNDSTSLTVGETALYESNNTVNITLDDGPKNISSDEQVNVSVPGVITEANGDLTPKIRFWNATDEAYVGNDTADLTVYESVFVEGVLLNETSRNQIPSDNVTVVFSDVDADNVDVEKVNISNSGTFGAHLPDQDAVSETLEYRATFLNDSYVNKSETFDAPTDDITDGVYLKPGGTIQGWVDNQNGNPITDSVNNSIVTAFNKSDGFGDRAQLNESGAYSIDVPEGTYKLTAAAEGNESKIRNGLVSVSQGDSKTDKNITLNASADNFATVTGTITDSDGDAIDGTDNEISVLAVNTTARAELAIDTINSSGGYNLTVEAGEQYAIAAFDSSGTNTYQEDFTYPVTLSNGDVATEDISLSEKDSAGTISGEITNESGSLQGAEVFIQDQSQANRNRALTESDGKFEFEQVPAGTYDIIVDHPDHAREIRNAEVEVGSGEDETIDVQLEESATIQGTVDLDSTTFGVVVAERQSDGQLFFSEFDGDGTVDYSVEVAPGDYRVNVFGPSVFAPAQEVTGVEAGGTDGNNDFDALTPEITGSNLTVTEEGSEDVDTGDLAAKTRLRQGALTVTLDNTSDSTGDVGISDLETANVTDNTRFRLNISVKDYKPESLLWGARDIDWETTQNESAAATDSEYNITVRFNATDLHGTTAKGAPVGPLLDRDPDAVDWPDGTGNAGDVGWNQTAQIGLFNLSRLPSDAQDNLAGLTVSTNAQSFALPQYDEETESLRLWVGGPSTTKYGERNDGFYRAFIPQNQLDDWGVTDPENELLTRYKGSSVEATVDDSPDDGVWIEITDYSYSASVFVVEPDPSTSDDEEDDTDSTSSSGGGGGVAQTEEDDDEGPSERIAEVREQLEQTIPDTETEVEIEDADPDSEGINIDTSEESETVSEITLNEEIDGTVEVREYSEPPEEVAQQVAETISQDLAADVEEDVSEEVSEDIEDDVSEDTAADDGEESTDAEDDDAAETDSGGGDAANVNVVTVADISPSSNSGSDAADTSATVTMSVDREDVNEPQNAVIVHETSEGWEELETDVEETAEGEVVLSGETDSFSLFAVAEVTESSDETEQTEESTEDSDEETNDGIPGFGVPVAVIAMITAAMIARRTRQ